MAVSPDVGRHNPRNNPPPTPDATMPTTPTNPNGSPVLASGSDTDDINPNPAIDSPVFLQSVARSVAPFFTPASLQASSYGRGLSVPQAGAPTAGDDLAAAVTNFLSPQPSDNRDLSWSARHPTNPPATPASPTDVTLAYGNFRGHEFDPPASTPTAVIPPAVQTGQVAANPTPVQQGRALHHQGDGQTQVVHGERREHPRGAAKHEAPRRLDAAQLKREAEGLGHDPIQLPNPVHIDAQQVAQGITVAADVVPGQMTQYTVQAKGMKAFEVNSANADAVMEKKLHISAGRADALIERAQAKIADALDVAIPGPTPTPTGPAVPVVPVTATNLPPVAAAPATPATGTPVAAPAPLPPAGYGQGVQIVEVPVAIPVGIPASYGYGPGYGQQYAGNPVIFGNGGGGYFGRGHHRGILDMVPCLHEGGREGGGMRIGPRGNGGAPRFRP